MKTFIVNSVKGVVDQKKKFDVTSKLMGREWRMLSDDPGVNCKYIFLKDGKLVLSVNGISTYTTWQMATPTAIIMDEGVGTFLYKIFHLDEDIIVLNLDGTENYCFLINDASAKIATLSFEDIQWYLFRHFDIDMLSEEQKRLNKGKLDVTLRNKELKAKEKEQDDKDLAIFLVVLGVILLIIIIIACGQSA